MLPQFCKDVFRCHHKILTHYDFRQISISNVDIMTKWVHADNRTAGIVF